MNTAVEHANVRDVAAASADATARLGDGVGSKPQIPRRFFAKSPLRVAELIVRGAALWLLPGLGAWLLIQAQADVVLTTFGVISLFLLAGQGLHLLGILAHDGSHGNLAEDRSRSSVVGILASSTIPLHCDVGFSINHSEHHRWLNTARDPDILLVARFDSYLGRVLLLRPVATRRYLRSTLRLAFGRWPEGQKNRLNLSLSQLVGLARLNLACSALWLSSYVALTWWSPLLAGCLVWGPYAGSAILSGVRVHVEHAGTGLPALEASRSYVHPIYTFLFGGTNYHLAHHMFPAVPLYRLPALHRWLAESGRLNGPRLHVDRTLWKYWRYPSLPYPKASPNASVEEQRSA